MLESIDTLIAFVLILTVVSLLITIVVQMISSALNLRGLNLLRGLTETLHTVAPSADAALQQRARALAQNLTTGSMVSDSSLRWLTAYLPKRLGNLWRITSAVRADEAFDALHRIATGQKKDAGAFREDARNLLVALGVDRAALEDLQDQADRAQDTLQHFSAAIQSVDPRVAAAFGDSEQMLQAYVAQLTQQAQAGAAHAATTIEQAYKKFQYWFDLGQERAQQWFAMRTRTFTILFSILFAFWWQLDAVEIFRLVSSNDTVRQELVARAGNLTEQADNILTQQTVLHDAVRALIAAEKNTTVAEALAKITVTTTDTRGAVRARVNVALGDPASTAFDDAVDELAKKRLADGQAQFKAVQASLDGTGFKLYPDHGHRWIGEEWSDHWGEHILGMLFSAALLSLGAPFWFNLLKGLTNLRTTVANHIADEKKALLEHGRVLQGAPPTV